MKTTLFLLYFIFFLQPNFSQTNYKNIAKNKIQLQKDSIRRAEGRGDSTYLFNFYSYSGVSIPQGSFARSSTEFNNLGKANNGFNFKAGIELFINSKNTVSLDHDAMIFDVTNDSLVKFVAKKAIGIYGTQDNYSGSISRAFDVRINNFGFGYSRKFNFGKFCIQTKLTPSFGRINYGFYAIYGLFPDTTGSVVISSKQQVGQGDFYCSLVYYYTIKPEINFKYRIYEQKRFALILNAGISYFQINPLVNLKTMGFSGSQTSEPVAFKDKVKVINTYFGINFVLKKRYRQLIK